MKNAKGLFLFGGYSYLSSQCEALAWSQSRVRHAADLYHSEYGKRDCRMDGASN